MSVGLKPVPLRGTTRAPMTELSDDKPTDDVLQKIASFFDSVRG